MDSDIFCNKTGTKTLFEMVISLFSCWMIISIDVPIWHNAPFLLLFLDLPMYLVKFFNLFISKDDDVCTGITCIWKMWKNIYITLKNCIFYFLDGYKLEWFCVFSSICVGESEEKNCFCFYCFHFSYQMDLYNSECEISALFGYAKNQQENILELCI